LNKFQSVKILKVIAIENEPVAMGIIKSISENESKNNRTNELLPYLFSLILNSKKNDTFQKNGCRVFF
jgi:hypothetical protein